VDDLRRLLNPRGIALVGASEDQARYGGRALRYALDGGFKGAIHAVNPKSPTLFGRPCYPALADVPGPVDVAVALVGPARIPDLMAACRAKGVRFLVAVGAVAEDAAGAARVRDEARGPGPRLVGPMSVGVVVPRAGAAMAISSGLVGGLPRTGRVAVVSQSGGILGAVIDRAQTSRVGFSALVSSGQELDLTTTDFVAALIEDDATRTIAVYMEGVDDWPRLLGLAALARARGKALAVLFAGRTAAGGAAALSHSGRMVGDSAIIAAALDRHGAVALTDIDDLHVTADALAKGRVAAGTGLAALSLSGGYAAMLGDRLSEAGVPLAELGAATCARLIAEGIQERPANPLDAVGGGGPGTEAEVLRAALSALADDPAVGALLYGETAFLDPASAVPVLAERAARSAKPHVVCWQSGPTVAPVLGALNEAGVTAVETPEAAARVLRALWAHASWRPVEAPADEPPLAVDDARAALASCGIDLVAEHVVPRGGDVGAAAAAIGCPVALKGLVPGLQHKTERNLVRLNLAGAEAASEAAAAMARDNPDLAAFGVQPMVEGLEFLIGVRNEPRIGPAVILAFGGVLAEAMDRRAVALAPLDATEAAAMIARVDAGHLLDGWRGSPALARGALRAMLVAVGRFAWRQRTMVAELDLNPVMVTPTRAVAVDWAIVAR
jgi:acyl-CoA synthetase (NDP forming)